MNRKEVKRWNPTIFKIPSYLLKHLNVYISLLVSFYGIINAIQYFMLGHYKDVEKLGFPRRYLAIEQQGKQENIHTKSASSPFSLCEKDVCAINCSNVKICENYDISPYDLDFSFFGWGGNSGRLVVRGCVCLVQHPRILTLRWHVAEKGRENIKKHTVGLPRYHWNGKVYRVPCALEIAKWR